MALRIPRTVCRWRLLAALAFLAMPASGQGLLSGRVVDASTGLALPGATVQVDSLSMGAVTNADGRFSLAIPRLPVVLTARFIGYRSRTLRLGRFPSGTLDIALEPEAVDLGEIVVSGEDPAYDIVRKALAAKQAWRDTVRTAYAEGYTRFTLLRELEPVRLEESISAVWWKAGDGPREIVRARRTRPARREVFRFAGPLAIPNLYDDDVPLDGTVFVGPLHPESTDRYDLRLVAVRSRDGRPVFDVAFRPTSATETGLVGMMAVEDSTFDVLEIAARPAADRRGPPPVIERWVQFSQTFTRMGGGMQPVAFRAEGGVTFGAPGASYPTARFRQVSGLSLHATRIPVPDTLFAEPPGRIDAPDVDRQAWLFDWNPGMVPLTEEEIASLGRVSAAPPLPVVFRAEGLLRQYLSVPVTERPVADPDRRPVTWVRPWAWFNRVDGWQVGLRPEVPLSRSWTLRPAAGYAEARGGWPWAVALVRAPETGLRLAAGADRFTAVTGEVVARDRLQLGLATWAGWDDYYDYFDRTRAYGSIGWAFPDQPLRFDVIASAERHRSAVKRSGHEGFLFRNRQRENPPVEEGGLTSVAFEVSRGDAALPGTRGGFYAGSRMELAQSGWRGSDFDYVRWSGALALRVPTLQRRRAEPATLRVDLFAGLGTDGIPAQRQGFLDMAVGVLAPGAGFRVPRGRMPLSKRWLAVFLQHDFGPAAGEWLGLAERPERWGVFTGHGRAWGDPVGWRHEVGIFVRNVVRLPLRINLASPADAFDPHVTVLFQAVRRR